MRTASLAIVFLVSASHLAFGQMTPSTDRTADRSEILNSISEISRAYIARDPAPFERLYLDNFVSIRNKAVYNMRDQLVAMMRADSIFLEAGKKLDFETLQYSSEDPQVNFYGRAAVVNVLKKHDWQYRGQKCRTRTQATEVWVKPETEWKIAANHSTVFQCNPKPVYPLHAAVSAMQSQEKAPANADLDAERQVRDFIRAFTAAQASLEEPLEAVLERFTADSYVSTDVRGSVGRDRTLLTAIPGAVPGRAPGLRNQDDAVLVYENAAVYTFRPRNPVRNPAGPSLNEGPHQYTVVLAKLNGRWLIVGAHVTKVSID